jgi:hypothetical protein
MNEKYFAIIQMMTEQFCKSYLPVAINNLENGILQWENMLDDNEHLNSLIHSSLESHWEDLVDNRNSYWDKESVTTEDKRFMFRRVKKDTVLHVKERIHRTLLELLQVSMKHYFEHENNMRSYYRSVFEKPEQQMMNIEDLLKMKSLLELILAKANEIAKAKIYLDARNLLPTDSLTLVAEESHLQVIQLDQDPSDKLNGNEMRIEEKPTIHIFERKLRGGYVPFVKSVVPELVVREHGFQHGDFLHVERMYSRHQMFRYRFSLAQKVNQPQHERRQINYCMIQQEKSMTYIEQYYDVTPQKNTGYSSLMDIRYDEVPYRFIIKEEDIRVFKLKAGEIVDIAFWQDNPLSVRVIWRHYPESIPLSIVHAVEETFKSKMQSK